MAAQLEPEGTGSSGENEQTKMETYLVDNRVSKDTIQKLISNELDTIEILKNIGEEDINDLCKEYGINVTQKIKLKSALMKLKDAKTHEPQNLPPILIDKEERVALTKMAEKVKAIEDSINLVAETTTDIDSQVAAHTNTIKSAFKALYESLDKRQQVLIQKINHIANEKRQKLQNLSNTLNQQRNTSKQKLQDCTKRVSKPIPIYEINTRINEISKIANEIDEIKIVTKENTAINDNKINILLNKKNINKTIDNFGTVSASAIPVLLSLTDNGDCTVGVKWNLEFKKSSKNKNQKLKIEWSETKSDDIEQFANVVDEKWGNDHQIDLNDNYDIIIDVAVDNKIANYFFRLKYFDGSTWSIGSNIKSLSIKEQLTDTWDPNCKHSDFQIQGNSIINIGGGQRSAYLTRVVKSGIHCWKFRIDNLISHHSCFGVWKTKYQPILTERMGESGGNKSYGFCPNCYSLFVPEHGRPQETKYGVKCKNGDTIEMVLNLVNYCLSYKINEKSYGHAFDIEKTSYRAGVTPDGRGSGKAKFTLLSYNYRAK
eukprot:38650_1